MKHRPLFFVLGWLFLFSCQPTSSEQAWQPLFPNADFTGWNRYLARPDASIEVPGWEKDSLGKYVQPLREKA
ncbi:MAG: hypothetical protein AAF399_03915 [Bacteroidota bacterium]